MSLATLAAGAVLAPAALAAGPSCQNDSEATQAGEPVDIFFDCTPSSGVTYKIVTGPSHGTLDQSNIASGYVGYTASSSYTGTDSFTFEATDTGGTSNVATVTMNVSPENQCQDGDQSTPANTAAQIFIFCSSGTGGNETYSIVSGPSHGSLDTSDISNGDVTYTPTSGYNGPDSFTYKANDGVMTAAAATVTIEVGNSCANQQVRTSENADPVGIFFQCTSASFGTETYSIVSGPSHGSLDQSDIANGDVAYQPNHGYVGTDSFTVRANDGSTNSNIATVTITVTQPPPSCQNNSVTTLENTAVTIPLRCISPAGNTMTLSIPSGDGPSHGTLTLNSSAQTATYTPKSGYVSDSVSGPDSFEYIATDSAGNASQPALVSVQVGIVCQATDATTNQNEPTKVPLYCTGPTGVPLTLSIVGPPTHGTLGTIDQGGQQVLYTPVSGYHGSDSFTFHASGGGQTSATVTVTLTVKAVTLACSSDFVSTPKNTAIAVPATCTNRAGQTLTLSTAPNGAPGHGSLSFDNTKQTITYTPTSGFTGADSFTYVASDGSGATPTATVFVNVGISCSAISDDTSVGVPVAVPLECTGPDGTPLTLAIASPPAHGKLGQILQLDGSVEYTPAAGFAGTDSFTYTATGGGQTTTAVKATITVSSPMPLCTDVTASTPPGAAVTIPLECGGPNGTTLTLSIASGPAHGTLGSVDNTHHTVTYTPRSGFVGQDEFFYEASGGGMTSAPAAVDITVGPTCSNSFDVVTVGQPTELNLSCVGERGQTLTLSITGQPLHGTLGPVDSGAQQVLYTPAAGYIGPDAITYKANDGSTDSNVATDLIDVEPAGFGAPAQPPACQDLDLGTPVSTQLKVPLSCVDPAGKTLTLLRLSGSGPSHGTLGAITQGSTPSVTYTPLSGYTGTDSFEYEASNGSAVSYPAHVYIQVGLECSPTQAEGPTGQAITVFLQCAGPGTLTYQIVSGPSHGKLGTVDSYGTAAYTPNSGFTGQDSFTYKVTSGSASSNVVTASVDVTPAGPACNDVSVATAESTAVTLPLHCTEQGATLTLFTGTDFGAPMHGTLGTINQSTQTVSYTPVTGFEGTDTFTYGASDGTVDGGANVTVTVGLSCSDVQQQVTENKAVTIPLSCVAPTGTTPTIATVKSPAHGTLGAINQSAQTVSYTPTSGYTGPDTFTIDASGNSQTSQPAVVSLDVQAAPPACIDVNVSTRVNTAVSVPMHCTGASGATLTLYVPSGSGPNSGTLGAINQSAQTVQYTPDSGFTGDDFFQYEASDGSHLSPTASVDVTVSNGPTCTAVSASTNEGVAKSIQLSCSGGTGTLAYAILSQPSHGTLSGFSASAGTVTYTPNSGYAGGDSFTYDASAGGQTSSPQSVAITVIPPPACSPASASTNENVATTVQLSCVDSAGRTLTLAKVTGPSHGTLGTINSAAQTVQYTPTSGFSGTDTFTYDATAGGQTSNTATVTITVNQAPGCNAVSVSTDTGHAVSVPLHCTDPQGRSLTLAIVSGPSHGSLGSINQTAQTIQYTPSTGYTGADSFTYNATATGGQGSNTATVSISVKPLPTCSGVSTTTAENQPVSVPLSCTGGTGSLTLAKVSGPSHGSLGAVDSAAQTVQYTPTSGYTGTDSFTYKATDAQGASSAAATVSLTVTPPPPVCSAVTVSTDAGHAASVPLHCTDQLGRTLTLSTVSGPSHGSLGSINQTAQTVQYTPSAGYTGTDSFTYKATASGGQASSPATVSITVNQTPACSAASASTTENQATSVQLSCTGGTGTLTLATVSGPSQGSVGAIDSAAQSVQYTPSSGYTGADSFTYKATDAQGVSSAPATASITVNAPPPPPPPTTTTTTTPPPTTTTTTTTQPPPPPPANGLTSLQLPGSASVNKKGVVSLLLSFQGSGSGSLKLLIIVVARHHKHTTKSIGSTSFSLSGGGTKTIAVHLNKLGKSKLKAAHKHLKVKVKLTFADGSHAPMTLALTLKGH